MTIHHQFFKDNSLLIQQYNGDTDANDILTFLSQLVADERYRQVRYIVSDFRRVKVTISEEDISAMVQQIVAHSLKEQVVFNAILVTEPMQTAFSYLYKVAMQGLTWYDSSVMSSLTVAASYVAIERWELEEHLRYFDQFS